MWMIKRQTCGCSQGTSWDSLKPLRFPGRELTQRLHQQQSPAGATTGKNARANHQGFATTLPESRPPRLRVPYSSSSPQEDFRSLRSNQRPNNITFVPCIWPFTPIGCGRTAEGGPETLRGASAVSHPYGWGYSQPVCRNTNPPKAPPRINHAEFTR